MAKEIEHKYIVTSSEYLEMATDSHYIAQGYLNSDSSRTVRVRIMDDEAYLTIKTKNEGDKRNEYEYPIPLGDANELIAVCEGRVIRKRRYIVMFDGMKWEVDAFEGDLYPLVIAEIELQDSNQEYSLPPFVGRNVTSDPRYFNSQLAKADVDINSMIK